MTPTPQAVSAQKTPGARPLLVPQRFVRPPRLWPLPQPRSRARGMLVSTVLHCLALAVLIFLPVVLPAPVVMNPAQSSELAQPLVLEPLVAPKLPELEDRGSASAQPVFHRTKPIPGASGAPEAPPAPVRLGKSLAPPPAEPPPQVPDLAGSQRIVSLDPNPVNRVQTIKRPDLVAPPKLKFPLRLQAQVNLPAPVVPVLDVPQAETPQLARTPVAIAQEDVPVSPPTVEKPVVTLAPKRTSAIRPEKVPSKTVAPNLRIAAGAKSASLKSLVVVNAVQVTADATPVPDAELAGSFVVGPSSEAGTTDKSAASGRGKSAANAGSNSAEGSPSGAAEGASGSGASSGAPAAVAGHSAGPGTSTSPDSRAGSGSGLHIIGAAGPGGGTGTSSGSGSGAPGRGSGNGSPTGISISGGVPGRSSGSVASAPMQRSYGMMIISGGNNGGASRDLGVFSRGETVYSVTIPVAGGPDWPMQYALSNPAQASAGLLVPPFVEKKAPATMSRSQMLGDGGPVFVTGTVDENGKTQSIRCLRSQDAGCQPALRALQQWEFLPAQLDGKPVAVRVLIGVTVSTVE